MKRNLALLFISLLISLFLAESMFYFLARRNPKPIPASWVKIPEQVWTEPNEKLGWHHIKNHRALLVKGKMEIPVHTNEDGFRGTKNYSSAKPDGKTRILVLGDSFVFGWGVQDGETFSAQLENHPGIEAINMGVAGYGIDQIYMSFHELGKKFNPDIVLIGIFPEDFWRATRAYTDAGYGKPYFRLSQNGELILNNSPTTDPKKIPYDQFPDVIEEGPIERIVAWTATYRYLRKKVLRLARDLGWIEPDLTEEWRLGRAILRQLMQDIRASGAQPVLFLMPPAQWMVNNKPTSIQKSLAMFAAKERVPLLDVTASFQEAVRQTDMRTYYLEDDDHWTAQGHAFAAEQILTFLNQTRHDPSH